MNKRKIVIAIVSLLFISLFIVLCLKSKTKTPSPLIPTPSPAEVPWETYSNQDYEYAISYPSNWQTEVWDIKEAANLTKIPDGSIWHQAKFKGDKEGFEILIWENETKVPLKTWLTWFRHEDLDLGKLPEKENYEIGGMPAILSPQEEAAGGKVLDHIFFQFEDKIYEFVEEKETTPTGETVTSNYDKMISSFLFLEDEVKVELKAENLVSLAKKDLGQKLGVNKEEIRLTKVEAVDWPDTSLGCPKPGMFYAQVITPGYKITLEGGGKSYIYHSDYKRVVLCQDIK